MKNAARLLALTIGIGLMVTMLGCPRKCVRPEEPIPPPPLPEKVADIVEPDDARLTLETVYFDLNQSDIRASEVPKLEASARHLNAPEAQAHKLSVDGHCCPIGTAAFNMALGMHRAESVKAFLVRLGVAADRLTVVSYGKEKLVSADPDKYEQNRRVELGVK